MRQSRLRVPAAVRNALAAVLWFGLGVGPICARADVPIDDGPAALQATEDGGRDGQGASAFEGRVAAYLLSPDATVSGLILSDGRTVRFPPHLGARLVEAIKVGDAVRVGLTGPEDEARARHTVTSVRTGSVLDDAPPPRDAGAAPPAPTPLRAMKLDGVVALVLQGRSGDIDGIVLDSGAQVSFPPHAGRALSSALAKGVQVEVDGFGRTTPFGTAVQATLVTPRGQAPFRVYPAPGRDRR